MMSELHKDLLRSLIQTWGPDQLKRYIEDLRLRREQLSEEIVFLQSILKRKSRKVVDTGMRDGH